MAEFVMPSLGADMQVGTLVTWVKHAGDHVERGEIIAEVDTDKGVIEVEVFTSGVIERLLVPEGSKVPVGTPLASIAEDIPAQERAATPANPAASTLASGVSDSPRPAVSPAARRRARELGVDPATLSGSGTEGAVTLRDVEIAAGAGRPSAESDLGHLRVRRAIASAMERSNREIPHFWLHHVIDFSEALSLLKLRNASRPVTERWVHGALLVKAVALALKDFPELNARWHAGRVEPNERVNVSMAISLRGGGLVVPAILDADRCSMDELMQRLTDLVERARRGQLRASELTRGTITVTSLGERGVMDVAGVIYPPQTALVGFGAPRLRPWVVRGEIVARPLLDVTLAADHRVSDGHRASRYLLALEKLLTQPSSLVEGQAT